uniref:GAF domain-containing protein n=1 Tax=Anisakis simplex TaxID=6269 RepID=A0A0M3JLT9_ANISI
LKLPSNETFRSTDEDALMDLSLQIPASSEHCAHTRIEGLLLITHRYAHSIRLPDTLEGNTDVGTVHSVPFIDNDVFIGAVEKRNLDLRFGFVATITGFILRKS